MSETNVLEPQVIESMKQELYYLIRDHCKTYKISEFRQELFLHDSTRIEFMESDISKLETFVSLVNNYWDYFPYIVSNIVFEYESEAIELSHKVVGTINFQKTAQLRANHASENIVCNVSSKNIFIPENVLLGSVILGINLLSSKFQQDGRKGLIENYVLSEHDKHLQKITDFTGFLLKDRIITRLVEHYQANHQSIEQPLLMTLQRSEQGKLREQYKPLLSFIKIWKSFSWILNQPGEPLRQALTPYLEQISPDMLYEMWIFYNILTLFEPIKQRKNNVFVNENTGLSVEYHKQKSIGWMLEKNGIASDIKRYPDIVIRRGNKELAIIDAKCMHHNELRDEDERQQQPQPGPDRNIVNQMIIYLDYGGRYDLGVVLFADDAIRNEVIVTQANRKIVFLNCYPFHETCDLALKKVSHYLSL